MRCDDYIPVFRRPAGRHVREEKRRRKRARYSLLPIRNEETKKETLKNVPEVWYLSDSKATVVAGRFPNNALCRFQGNCARPIRRLLSPFDLVTGPPGQDTFSLSHQTSPASMTIRANDSESIRLTPSAEIEVSTLPWCHTMNIRS